MAASLRAGGAVAICPVRHPTRRPRFQWRDPLLLYDDLREDERQIADAARVFAQGELLPRVEQAYLDDSTDPGLFKLMGAAGLLGVTVPAEYGCAGANYVAYGLVAREVERVDSGFRSMMSVQSSLVMFPILEFGTEAQRRKYLPSLGTGELIGCFGLTEPEAGSDPGGMKTRAEKIAGGYRLTEARPGSRTRRSRTSSSSGRSRWRMAARSAASSSKKAARASRHPR